MISQARICFPGSTASNLHRPYAIFRSKQPEGYLGNQRRTNHMNGNFCGSRKKENRMPNIPRPPLPLVGLLVERGFVVCLEVMIDCRSDAARKMAPPDPLLRGSLVGGLPAGMGSQEENQPITLGSVA